MIRLDLKQLHWQILSSSSKVEVDSYNPMDRSDVTLMQTIDMFGNRSACLGNSRAMLMAMPVMPAGRTMLALVC